MTPVEELRAAATLMRERARGTAEPAPWFAMRSGAVASITESSKIAFTVAETSKGAGTTADHIASWHPGVALAVADWLDGIASKEAARVSCGTRYPVTGIDEALTVARAYLGEA